jgi:lon-related putative ATP-dependent protease
VVLLGSQLLYHLLRFYDPDFEELFKVPADFSEHMDRSDAAQQLYAHLIATLVRKERLKPLGRAAVERVIEQSSRLAGDAKKLSLDMRRMLDLLQEAGYWSERSGNGVVTVQDVERAINARIYRSDRVREQIQGEISRGTLLIETKGDAVGQVNGLAITASGQLWFGRPSRITASVRMGDGKLIDIEREVALGGPLHSKGVLILAGFLNGRYATDVPLSLSASLVFEQSYAGIGGDSASSAELYALLSAIARVPVEQSIAVTGSVNQYGQVQAIGAVNEKIEGFFDTCRAGGLTGTQGVIIPKANVQHLMLRRDVVDGVGEGMFHIWPVRTIDEGIEILTDLSAGAADDDGHYPGDTFNGRVQKRLVDLAERRQKYEMRLRQS